MSADSQRRVPTRIRLRDQIVALTWLTLAWNLFWANFSWGNVMAGLLVGLVVLAMFPLPRVTFRGRVRPLRVAHFVASFLVDVVIASVQVMWIALRPAPPPRNAIVAVPLRVRSDLNLTLAAEALSLVPGTLIVEADPETGTLYVHALNARSKADVERVRRQVLAIEARIVAAVGSAAELRRVRAGKGSAAGKGGTT